MNRKTLIALLVAVGMSGLLGCSKDKPLPAQKVEVEVVATYLNTHNVWLTCVKFEDGTRCELNGRLGNTGDKFAVWRRQPNQIYLQEP